MRGVCLVRCISLFIVLNKVGFDQHTGVTAAREQAAYTPIHTQTGTSELSAVLRGQRTVDRVTQSAVPVRRGPPGPRTRLVWTRPSLANANRLRFRLFHVCERDTACLRHASLAEVVSLTNE